MPAFAPLVHPPAFPADRYAPLADRLKRLLRTACDVVFVQAEAIVALEAAAASLARPGVVATNVVTSPYGAWFGAWLRRGGANVTDVVARAEDPASFDAVERAIGEARRVDLVAMVHAESANGSLNPLERLARLAREKGALVVVDAVASFGGHPLPVDELGIDVAVIGPQKALGGSSGLSVVSVSARAWERMPRRDGAPPSALALHDLKDLWIDRGRGALPGMPPPLEFWSLEAVVDAVEAERLDTLIARHEKARHASRAGLRGLGPGPWIADDAYASALVTTAPVPEGVATADIVAAAAALGAAVSPAVGDAAGRAVRLDHTGAHAAFAQVLANVVAYGSVLAQRGVKVDVGAAAAAVSAAYAEG